MKETIQTTEEFEAVIKEHIDQMWRRPEYLTAEGVEVARQFLLEKAGNSAGASGVRGVIKRAGKLNTLRAIAYNLAQPGDHRLSDGTPCGF